jgi:hypothetical protein
MIIFSYFAGHLLKGLSKYGIPVWALIFRKLKPKITPSCSWLCFIMLIGEPQSNSSHRDKFKDFKESAATNLVRRLGMTDSALSDWGNFYFFAKNFIGEVGKHSLISTYQNKYTLHRSLAGLVGLLFTVCIFSLLVASVFSATATSSGKLLLLASCVISLVLTWHFTTSYQEYWRLLGDAVIAEVTVILSVKDADEKRSDKPSGD